MILFIQDSNEVLDKYGYKTALKTLYKGLNIIEEGFTLNQNEAFDVIVCQDHWGAKRAIDIKAKSGKPLIASLHLPNSDEPDEKLLIDACDGIIVYSKICKEVVIKKYNPNKPIFVVQLGIDTDLWGYDNKERKDFVLFTGRGNASNKGLLDLIWKCLSVSVPFKVAGDAASSVNNETFLGWVDQTHLRELYNQAKIHVLPSTYEPFGLVSLEAMACGCPVAISDASGVSEIVNDSVAVRFNPRDYDISDLIARSPRDSEAISAFAKKFDHISHAKDFARKVKWITSIQFKFPSEIREQAEEVVREVGIGLYDAIDVKDKVVVDAGAFLGETAKLFCQRGAKAVYAIEPSDACAFIFENCKNMPVMLVKMAIKDHNGTIRIEEGVESNRRAIDSDAGQEVVSQTLDFFCEENNIQDAVLKMDIEGDESVILGTKPENLRRFSGMMIETHDDNGLLIAAYIKRSGFDVDVMNMTDKLNMVYARRI